MLMMETAESRIKKISKSENEYNFLVKLYNEGKLGNHGGMVQYAWNNLNLVAAQKLLNADEIKFDGDAQSYLMDFIEDVKSSIKQQKWAIDNNIMY